MRESTWTQAVMKLVPDQEAAIERQRREDPDRRHFMLEFTPEQKADWERAVAEEMTYKQENIRYGRELLKVLRDDGFSSKIRRAIVASRQDVFALAERIGIDRRLMADFLAGDASLPTAAIDRLIRELNLTVQLHEETAESV